TPSEWGSFVIEKCVELRRILHEEGLRHIRKRTGEKVQKVSHRGVVSACGCSCKTGHVRRADCRRRNRGELRLTADRAWHCCGNCARASHFVRKRVASTKFGACFEGMFAFGPAQVVAIRPEDSRIEI